MSIIIHALQIIIFQFLTTSKLSKLSYKQALARNKEWVKENRDALSGFSEPKSRFHVYLGVVLLVLLATAAIMQSSPLILVVKYLSLSALLIQSLGIDMLRYHRMKKIIPAKATRQANLLPRTLSQYIPKSLSIVTGVIQVVLIAAIGYQFIGGAISVQQFWKISSPLLISFFIFTPILIYTIKRKPIEATNKVATLYRKSEVLIVSLGIASVTLLALSRFLSIQFNMPILNLSNEIINYISVLAPMLFFTWFCLNKNFRQIIEEEV